MRTSAVPLPTFPITAAGSKDVSPKFSDTVHKSVGVQRG